MSDTFISRADLFGTIIWTPAMESKRAADMVAAIVQTVAIDNDCIDFRGFARALAVHGGKLIYNPDHHGERDTWTLLVDPGMWLETRINEVI